MKTHIRMHFDKKLSDCNEESYIACISADDSKEGAPNHVQRAAPSQTSVISSISNNAISHIPRAALSQGSKTPHVIEDDEVEAITLPR